MAVTTLWVTDFRCFRQTVFEPDPAGLTVLRGENGAGKTSLLEAVAWLATQRSFRGAPREALVRTGCERAVLRAETTHDARRVLVEAELPVAGTARVHVNRQSVRRRADLGEAVRVSIFSPDDLSLVQEGPAYRRDYLDEALIGRHPRFEALQTDVDRILRQRGAVLRQAGGTGGREVDATLDVWDDRLAQAGESLVEARADLIRTLTPFVAEAYARLAGPAATGPTGRAPARVTELTGPGDGEVDMFDGSRAVDRADEGESAAESAVGVELEYRRSWDGPLIDALSATRRDDLRRQVTSVGPHRDDVEISVDHRPVRSQASQGEQRCVALALRLATHRLACADHDEPPVLLLDDVFSELDHKRASALVAELPPGQVLLTTAVDPPPSVTPDRVVEVAGGRLVGAGGVR